jgi:hypothetical protein
LGCNARRLRIDDCGWRIGIERLSIADGGWRIYLLAIYWRIRNRQPRNATEALTCVARRAGTYMASADVTINTTPTATNVSVSSGVT